MNSVDPVDVWVGEAGKDLEVAEVLIERGYYDRSIFHSQQAAEKAVKALFMAANGSIAPRTHRIDRLAEDLGASNDIIAEGASLTSEYMAV